MRRLILEIMAPAEVRAADARDAASIAAVHAAAFADTGRAGTVPVEASLVEWLLADADVLADSSFVAVAEHAWAHFGTRRLSIGYDPGEVQFAGAHFIEPVAKTRLHGDGAVDHGRL